MTKPRGNKTSAAARAERQAKEIALMNEGKTQAQIADELGISRATFWRDISTLTKNYAEGNQTAFAELRTMQVGALLDMAKEVHDEVITPETGNSIRGFLDSVSRLLGLEAPRRTESRSTNVNVEGGSVENFGLYKRFFHEIRGLEPDQIELVWDFCNSLVRRPVDTGWGPKLLEEAGS
ncbi:MAG TPA: HTH domain-containing protein [Terriglobales bacterium]|jgi:DNA-binding CsgD family transcriptional regulator|nr:HTH domain-containing protein [Terriglobales bacterium]